MKQKLLLTLLALFTLGGSNLFAQTWTGNEVANGTFFLYNVGAQKFLNNGDPKEGWGTNAYLQKGFGLDVTLAAISDDVYTIETGVKNNDTDHYLATSTWCDGGATNWTFTPIAEGSTVYTISNGESYLVANDALDDVVYGALSSTEANNQWLLVTLDDFKNAMKARAYSETEPMDVSVFIKGRSFARNDTRNSSWTTSHNGGNWTWIGSTENKYYGNESWNNTFDVHQAISGLPEGTYEVQCSGFGTNGTTFIYGNTTSKALQTDNTTSWGTDKEAKWKAIHEDNAFAGNSTGTFAVGDGNLTLGLKRETNNGGDWCVYDEFRLYFYGLDLSGFAATLATAVAAAEALEGTIPSAAYTALKAIVDENNKTYTNVADYTAATNAITEATNNAKALQSPYNNYKTARTNVLALKSQTTFVDEGGTAAAQLDADVVSADDDAEAATTVEAINAAIKQVRTAAGTFAGSVKVNKGEYLDLTDAMLFNAAMRETGGLSLWNIVSNTNPAYPKYNGRCSEFWSANFEFNQTAYNMPAGNYNIEVYAFHRAGNYNTYLYANNDKIQVLPIANGENSMDAAANAFDQGLYLNSLKITLDEAQDVVIGFKNEDTETDKWTIFRDFKIKFFGDDALAVFRDEYESALAEAEAALASEDYANVTGEEMTALNTAVTETYPKTVVEVDETQEKFETATAALKEVTTIFKSAKAAYDKFAAAKAAAAGNKVDYPYASAEKLAAYQANITDATTATEASTKADAIVPSYRAYVESNALAEGVEGAVDLTSKIKQDAIADWTAEITGSTATFVLKNADGNDADTYTAADGTKGKNLIDSGNLWEASSWTAKMTQNVNLTPGKYILTASSRGSNDLSTFKLLADDKSVDMDHTGAAVGNGVFDRGFNDYFVEFELTETKDVVIGFEAATEAAHNWCSVARFRLAQLESTAEWATDEDLTAFAEALQATAKLGFDEGDYAPYNNVESLTAAEAEVAKVNTELEAYEGKATKATVAAATEAVKALTWVANETEMNAVYDGTFAYAVNNGAPAGWTMSNNTLGGDYHSRAFNPDDRLVEFNETKSGFFIRFDGTNSNRGSMYFYGRTTGYTMPLKANTTYYVKADFAGWGSTGKPLRMNVTGPEGFTAVGLTQTTTVRADNADETPQQFLIVFTTADAGNYEINFQTPGADTNTHNVLVSNIELFKAQPVNITIKAGRQYTAFSSNMPLDFIDSELTAEIVTSAAGTTKTVTKVPANTGIIVGLAEATTEAKTISVPVCAGETDDVTGNMLVAVLKTTTIPQTVDGYTNYVFGKSGGKEQFFKVRADGMEVPANNAYLTIPDAQAKGLDEIGLNGDATGISTIENADMQNGEVYNLQGQKVNRAQKGVYIVNGKKVILK